MWSRTGLGRTVSAHEVSVASVKAAFSGEHFGPDLFTLGSLVAGPKIKHVLEQTSVRGQFEEPGPAAAMALLRGLKARFLP